MIRVNLQNHTFSYPVCDVLRLFCFNAVLLSPSEVEVDYPNHFDIISKIECGLVTTSCEQIYEFNISTQYHDDKEMKREIKRQMYIILNRITGRSFPWGALTGIRPTLLAREEKDAKKLKDKYFVREDKAKLAIQTAKGEDEIITSLRPGMISLYIGIPFCPSRCSYCSFASSDVFSNKEWLEKYTQALLQEMNELGDVISQVESIYVGGGTPTILDESMLYRILSTCEKYINRSIIKEFTVEAGRPETINATKLSMLKKFDVSRICVNPQTLSDNTLTRIGRMHSVQDFYDAFELVRSIGFECINTDLIAGLPGETPCLFKESMDGIIRLQPENITIHTLYKKRTAQMQKDEVLRGHKEQAIDSMLFYAHEQLEANGYNPYYLYKQKDTIGGHENVGYTLPRRGSIYNVAMMSDQFSVLALGAGSTSKRIFSKGRLERCGCVRDPAVYISRVGEMAEKKRRFFAMD